MFGKIKYISRNKFSITFGFKLKSDIGHPSFTPPFLSACSRPFSKQLLAKAVSSQDRGGSSQLDVALLQLDRLSVAGLLLPLLQPVLVLLDRQEPLGPAQLGVIKCFMMT